MNQTTSGCGNCYYYFNGQCAKVDKCAHTGNYGTIPSNHTIGINEYGSNLPDDIVNNLPDDIISYLPDDVIPLKLIKPNEPNRNCINYDVMLGVFYCPICGNEIPWYEGQNTNMTRICDECKQAIAWAKEKMKENE